MSLPNHLFVVVFAVIYPIAGYIGYRRLLRNIWAGMLVNRGNLYAQTICWQWVLFGLAVIMWVISECPWGMLGFNLDLNDRVPIGTALTMAGVAFLFAQVRQVATASTEEVQGRSESCHS